MARTLRKSAEEEQQQEANMFAAHLLVPSKFLRAEVARMKGVDLIDQEGVGHLAAHFQVSESLITLRLLEEYKGVQIW